MPMLDKNSEPPKKGKGSKISTKMALFVNEYFVDLCAYKAVVRAGYKVRSHQNAVAMATQLMNHPHVRKAIEERMAEKREQSELEASYVIQKLIKIVEDTESNNPQAALRGLELLGKHLGLYRDKQEISGPDGGAIEVQKKKVSDDVADFTSRIDRLAQCRGEGGVVKFPVPRSDSGA